MSDSGAAIAPNDPAWPRLTSRAQQARRDPRAWLAMRDIFGDLGDDARYIAAFSQALRALWQDGTRATIARHLRSTSE
jgi:mannitol 2-dehydrogenase